ncbi:MAG: DUF3486 family protein [Crinalium sp.]
MPRRSSVNQLPEEFKSELDQRLISTEFSNYQGLADWLLEQGFSISRSAIHRYGQEFEKQLSTIKTVTEQAKAIVETVGDDENNLADALTRLAQQKAFQALVDLDLYSEASEKLTIKDLGQMVAALNKSSISLKKYQTEVKEKLEAKFKDLDAEGGKGGKLDPETLRRVREEIYGIF